MGTLLALLALTGGFGLGWSQRGRLRFRRTGKLERRERKLTSFRRSGATCSTCRGSS